MADLAGSGVGARRTADVLLRAANGRSAMLRMPAPATPGSAAEQLGLATPEFQDIELAPVVFRKARAKVAAGKATVREMLVSAPAVTALAASSGLASASATFATAFGVLVDETLLTIESVSEITAGGAVCGYRLLLREPVAVEI